MLPRQLYGLKWKVLKSVLDDLLIQTSSSCVLSVMSDGFEQITDR